MVVTAILASMAAIGLPLSNGMIDDIKLRGDAQALSAAVAQTKLTSAARFTHARLYANLTMGTYRIQTWNRTGTPGWVAASDEMLLSDRATFGFGGVTAPPPNTIATLTQAPACLDDAGGTIPGTACLLFSSRGIPIVANGTPAPAHGLFLHGNSGIFGVMVGAAGQQQVWFTTQAGATSWRQK